MQGYAWYGSLLTGCEGQVYEALARGLSRGDSEIRVPKCEPERISRILEQVRLDDPLLFYVGGMRYRTVRGEPTLTVLPDYTFRQQQRKEMAVSLEKRLQRITAPMLSMPAQAAIESIHEFLLENVIYDKVKKHYSHEIIGVLHHGIGVCEGISKTVKAICDLLDVPCIIALGADLPGEPRQRHAWNLIRTDGAWMHYDFTFDLSASRPGFSCRRYFGMSDAESLRIHGEPEVALPKCELP